MTEWYDDGAFRIEQKRYGLWESYDKDGKGIVTSLTEEECVNATRWYLKFKFEKNIDENEKSYQGTMEYKL